MEEHMTAAVKETADAPPAHPFEYHPEGKPEYFEFTGPPVASPYSGVTRTPVMRLQPSDQHFDHFKALHERCSYFERLAEALERKLLEAQAAINGLRQENESLRNHAQQHAELDQVKRERQQKKG